MGTDDQEENRQGTELRHGRVSTRAMARLRRPRILGLVWAALAILFVCGFPLSPLAKHSRTVTIKPEPIDIIAGPDGNLWFTEGPVTTIGRITPRGELTEFEVPTSGASVDGIIVGPDGNIWFGSGGRGGMIGRIIPSVADTRLFYRTAGRPPRALALGPDGALWFAASSSADIGRVTTAGKLTIFPLPGQNPPRSLPTGIAAGPDGNMWFTESSGHAIGRITPRGEMAEFVVPKAGASIYGIVVGPDGNIWFPEYSIGRIGRISIDGTFVDFALPADPADPAWIDKPISLAVGQDGNLWLTVRGKSDDTVLRMTTTGRIVSRFPLGMGVHAYKLVAGPDGNIWFTSPGESRIGRVTPVGGVTTFDLPAHRVEVSS